VAMFAVSFILLALYAPADTEERPLVCEKARHDLKKSSLVTAGILFIIAMILPVNNIVGNIIAWSVIIESVMTTPMIYYFFNRRYRNYEYYES
jgi:accessory gene regulator B